MELQRISDEEKDDFEFNVMNLHDEDDAIFIDDRSGKEFPTTMGRKARKSEITTMKEMKVYDKVPLRVVRARGGTIIDVRWLDVNKADFGLTPDVRSRMVAKDFATTARDDIFAGILALEAVKLLLSLVASSGNGRRPQKRIMVLDAKRALLYADMKREVYIRLPAEDTENDKEEMVGRLRKAMYGTREAPQSWQAHVTQILHSRGFKSGKDNPCIFRHEARDIPVAVHVDDFLISGLPKDLHWIKEELNKHFESKSVTSGSDSGQARETKYLGRALK